MVICPDCGKEVPKAKFCRNCGAHIADVEESEVAVPEVESVDVAEIEEDVEIPAEAVEVEETAPVPVTIKSEGTNKPKFCYNCRFELDGEYKFCPNCGADLACPSSNPPAAAPRKEKYMLVSIILSVFLPGLGQLYLGLNRKGAIFLIAYIISAILVLFFIGFILCFVIWIWALVDVILSTGAINRGEDVEDKLL